VLLCFKDLLSGVNDIWSVMREELRRGSCLFGGSKQATTFKSKSVMRWNRAVIAKVNTVGAAIGSDIIGLA
jgi:hypothetical protein